MDLGYIFKEILSWIIIFGVFLPYFRKIKKAVVVKTAAVPKRAAAPRPTPARGRQTSSTRPGKLRPTDAVRVAARHDLPDEGVSAVAGPGPAAPVQAAVQPASCAARKRRLREALVWNEILQRKY